MLSIILFVIWSHTSLHSLFCPRITGNSQSDFKRISQFFLLCITNLTRSFVWPKPISLFVAGRSSKVFIHSLFWVDSHVQIWCLVEKQRQMSSGIRTVLNLYFCWSGIRDLRVGLFKRKRNNIDECGTGNTLPHKLPSDVVSTPVLVFGLICTMNPELNSILNL